VREKVETKSKTRPMVKGIVVWSGINRAGKKPSKRRSLNCIIIEQYRPWGPTLLAIPGKPRATASKVVEIHQRLDLLTQPPCSTT
jgi:hypothetical protein